MCFKMMYNIITFKNVFQYQMANFNSVKLQFLLYQRNMWGSLYSKINEMESKPAQQPS